MFIDASALVAILLSEPEADQLAQRLEKFEVRTTSPLAVWETVVAIARVRGLSTADASSTLQTYLNAANIQTIAVDSQTGLLALEAHENFGKGRHPAGLNFGDCFAYASARQLGQPLLYKGDDFALTDIETA